MRARLASARRPAVIRGAARQCGARARRHRVPSGAGPGPVSPTRTSRPPALRYRPARRTDVENLAELGMLAYRVASLEKRRDFYTDHPRFTLRDVRVAELDGRMVG